MRSISFLLLLVTSCGGVPFTTADSVMMTTDAQSESAFVGSEPVIGQSEPLDQADGAVLPTDADSGDASWAPTEPPPMQDANVAPGTDASIRDGGSEVCCDASPDYSPPACMPTTCPSCGNGYNPCCKSTGCGCVSAIFPQGCY